MSKETKQVTGMIKPREIKLELRENGDVYMSMIDDHSEAFGMLDDEKSKQIIDILTSRKSNRTD